jgi:hypothetical protein
MRVTRTDLIDKYGYDTKYASHVVRLGFQGRELLETGKLILPMSGSDLEFTAAVKFGKIQLDEVLTTVGDLELQIKDLIKDGPLQDRPDYARVEEWMQAQYLDAWAPQSSGNWMGIVE